MVVQFRTIRHKLAFFVLLSTLTVLVLSRGFFLVRDIQDKDQNLQQELKSMVGLAALSLSEPLWQYSENEIKMIGEALFQNPNVAFLEIRDSFGHLQYEKRTGELVDNNHLVEMSTEIFKNDLSLGSVRLGLSKELRDRKVRDEILYFVLEVLLMTLILWIIIQRISLAVTRSLDQLSEGAEEVAAGNLDRRIEVSTRDEIGRLAEKFNYMSEQIQKSREERNRAEMALRSSHDQLEANVMERTQDLMAMNQELQAVNMEITQVNDSLAKEIQERRRAEEKLAVANRELTNAMEELKGTQDELIQSEKMAALGSLVAGITHEINTPVGIGVTAASHLETLTQDLKGRYGNGQITRQWMEQYINDSLEAVNIMQVNLDRASKLIRSFKQVSVDQSSEVQRLFSVKAYLDEILLSLQPKLKKLKHVITVEGDSRLEIDGYPGAFSQIITNLILNSLQHAFDPEQKGNILISFAVEEKTFILHYRDDGKGMTEEVRDKIFEPFFTTKRGQGGSGLGLYILRNLVSQKFGGQVECESKLGDGTSFTIQIPLERKEDVQ